jgi:NADH dehydrogenase
MNTTHLLQVVIVGAGFGGLEVARRLRNAPAHVVVIDRHNYHLFQPLLYQVATADLAPTEISEPIRSALHRQRNTEVLLAEVTGVDTEGHRVLLLDRTGHDHAVPYDYLVLATGARFNYFGYNEWARFAPGPKSLSDALAIRHKILCAFEAAELETNPEQRQAYLTFIIVGGGPTGVEMAGAIAELARRVLVVDFRHMNPASARILLVEALPRILPAFPEALARKARAALERLGVEVRTNTRVEQIDATGVIVAGKRLPAKTVIWSAGVKASPAAGWLDAKTDRAGRVVVQSDLTVPGYPEIFVIGDVASVNDRGKILPGVAPVAMQEGRYVAAVIRHRLAGATAEAPFRYHDKGNLATVGRAFAVADLGRVRLSGFIAWLSWMSVHLFFLIGFRNRLLVMIQWAWAYCTRQRGGRLILADEQPVCWTPSEALEQAATNGCRTHTAAGRPHIEMARERAIRAG